MARDGRERPTAIWHSSVHTLLHQLGMRTIKDLARQGGCPVAPHFCRARLSLNPALGVPGDHDPFLSVPTRANRNIVDSRIARADRRKRHGLKGSPARRTHSLLDAIGNVPESLRVSSRHASFVGTTSGVNIVMPRVGCVRQGHVDESEAAGGCSRA